MKKITLAILAVLLVPLTIWYLAGGVSEDEARVEPAPGDIPSIEGPAPAAPVSGTGRVAVSVRDEVSKPVSSRTELLLVHGRFVDDEFGEPVADCRLFWQDGNIRRHVTRSDAKGRFAFSPFEGEGVVLLASAPFGWRVESEEVTPTRAQRDGEEPLELRVHRLRGAILRAQLVEHESDHPLAGVQIGMRPQGAPSWTW